MSRLRRVIQQLKSFGDLHSGELELLAQQLEASGAVEVAGRLRAYVQLQGDENQMVVDELVDLQSDLAGVAEPREAVSATLDPAANSPKRAKWLAEAERLRQPLSRRDLLGRVAPTADDSGRV